MKKKLIFTLMMLVVCSSILGNIYGVKSGYVEYKLTGTEVGTKKLWFDDYGKYVREEIDSVTTMELFGQVMKEEKREITILTPEERYEINLIEGKGTIGLVVEGFGFGRFEEYLDDEEMETLGIEMLEEMGGKFIGKETFLNREVLVIELMGLRSYNYKKIPLKMVGETMGFPISEVAVKFDENAKVSKDKFVPPQNIAYKDIREETRQIFGMEETISLEYTIEEFEGSTNNVKISGFNKTFVQDTGEGYMLMYMKGLEEVVVLAMVPYEAGIESEIPYSPIKVDGKKAYYGEESEDGMIVKTLFVKSEDGTYLIGVTSTGKNHNKDDLIKIYRQIEL